MNVSDPAYEALRRGAAWLDVSDRGKLRLTGDDRARLLHALSTNDIQNLAPRKTVYAFFLNEKGRILADAYIHNLGDSLWVDTEPETRAKLIEHLDRYIIADDVTVTDESAAWTCLEAPAGLQLPESAFVVEASSTGAPLVRVFLPVAEREHLRIELPQATRDQAEMVRLENAIPRYGADITERDLVQETQILHAIHSNKGCYLGQEIVERVRSRGQVHRLLVPVSVEGTAVPPIGEAILRDDASVGEMRSSALSPAVQQIVGLAYLRREALEKPAVLRVNGAELAVRDNVQRPM